jgi:hypothetical protein
MFQDGFWVSGVCFAKNLRVEVVEVGVLNVVDRVVNNAQKVNRLCVLVVFKE